MNKELLCETKDGRIKLIIVKDQLIECYKAEVHISISNLQKDWQSLPKDQVIITKGEKIGELHILSDGTTLNLKRKHGFLRGQNRSNLIHDLQCNKYTFSELSDEYNVAEQFINKLSRTLEPA